ncbi:helix-turn-helix domain-containing protein [Aquimarina sp. ERC-38]|uniref:helix-turn-helix domain-containing protein n=1 Tax=Aquimarina sp. ERC-38 TaxID=2949996 RepID=UPI0022452BF8|nr:helix-turn-helix transcriptional regulator [Aquimarina sp. ERC-38]UZO82345.1 helix-turn-helix domain-containing protein [Aquimarina sp. ERC-38]
MMEVLDRIKEIRKHKGYSHEYIANELNISQVAYSKLEKNETKLTVERLYQLSEISETPIEDFLSSKGKNTINQNLYDSSTGYVENLYQENKEKTNKIIELYEARLADKDRLIDQLSI